MTICSLIVQAIPEYLDSVTHSLKAMDGVEIHAQDDHGKLIVSIDHPSRSYCGNAMTEMARLHGVMSAALVYEYQEDLEPNNASNKNDVAEPKTQQTAKASHNPNPANPLTNQPLSFHAHHSDGDL